MTRSLANDLRALAQSGPVDPGAGIADRTGLMVRAIRRRRAARQTGMSAVGVSAAAALAVGVSNGPAWLLSRPAGDREAGDVTTPETPDALELLPTEQPVATTPPAPTGETGEPTEPTEPVASSGGAVVSGGLAIIAERYLVDLRCGAPLTGRSLVMDSGAYWADHLTPRFETVPTGVDQPVRIVNEYGRDDPGPIDDGWSRMTPAVVVAADGVLIGFGGGTLLDGPAVPVRRDFAVDLPALQTCPTAEPVSGVVTVYGLDSIAGLDGGQHPEPPPVRDEALHLSYGLSIDLATGEQWLGEPGDREAAIADGLVPMP